MNSEHTGMKQRRTNRVVSKRDYISHVGKNATLYTAGMVAFVTGGLGLLIACLGLLTGTDTEDHPDPISVVEFVVVAGGLSALLTWSGWLMLKKASKAEIVLPLTRYTVVKLLIEESLVRASAEPTTPTETLLCAANPSEEETPSEELLRASMLEK